MNTKERGDIAVGQAINYFLSHGYEVALPIGDKRPYDLIVEKKETLFRVQVKYAGLYKNGKCIVGLRITGGNQSYNYARKYQKNSFDFLFVYTQRGKSYLLPWKRVDCRNALSVEIERYKKYNV